MLLAQANLVTQRTAVEHNIHLLSQVEGQNDATLAHAAPATASAAAVDCWEGCSARCQSQVALHCSCAQVLPQKSQMLRSLHSCHGTCYAACTDAMTATAASTSFQLRTTWMFGCENLRNQAARHMSRHRQRLCLQAQLSLGL